MADLDDFFAKKDKKKGKKGDKKFSRANADDLAKNLEESAKKEQKAQDKEITNISEEKNPAVIMGTTPLNPQDDEEWLDYRENNKDYTNLKIENLTIEEPVKEEEEETEINEDGEVVKKAKDESGPWNKDKVAGGAQVVVVEEAPQEQEPSSSMPNVVGGSYVPPHMRGQPAGGASPAAETRRQPPRRMRAAPDISSEVYFPSLSSAAEDTAPKGAWGKKLVKEEGAFEEVRESGKSQAQHRANEAPKIALGNKFDALRDE